MFGAGAVLADEYESRLIDIAGQIEQGHLERALADAKDLASRYPGGRLGRLLYADLLFSRAGVVDVVGVGGGGRELDQLRRELKARWRRIVHEGHLPEHRLPDALLKLAPSTDHVLFADLSRSRLFVFANNGGRLKPVYDFYVTQGFNGSGKQSEGDQRTPVGVYYVTDFIDGAALPSRYGPGALPISYPNAMDRRRRRTGHGIWIHGTEPFLVNRAPEASDGCLSLNNDDFLDLKVTIEDVRHTPVIIDDAPRWVSRETLETRREELLNAIEKWRLDWESGNASRYLSNYDEKRFTDGMRKYPEWSSRKRLVITNKSRIHVKIEQLELFGYPGEQNVVLADFIQRYDSDRFDSTMRKQQHWKRGDDGTWKIIFEGRSDKTPPARMAQERTDSSTGPSSS